MKRIFILVMLAIATLQSSAQTWPNNYTRLNSNYYWRMGAFDALNLPTRDTSLLTGQWVKAGSIIFDSTQAAGSRVWVYNGTYWERLGAGGEGFVSIGAENGLTAVNDSTLRLGGTYIDSITHRQLTVGSKTDQNTLATTYVDVISNRTLAQDKSVSDWIYWVRRGANALKWYNRQFYESENDTAAQQYNATINIFNRNTQDFSSSRFDYDAGGRSTNMQYAGVYSINQLYPVKSTLIEPGWFGRDGANFAASMGFGKDSTYDIQFQPSSRYPVPISNFKSDIDLNRAVPSSRARTMNGIGVSGYTAGWRSYQSSQGTASTSTPSYIGRITDFTSLGSVDIDPFNGQGFSKSDILARSEVDSVIGYHSRPKYTLQNEARNGYAIWQEGEHDYSYFQGKVRIRGSMPDRAGTDTMQQQFEVFGNTLLQGSNNLRFRGSATGTFPGMYWLLAPDSAGSQASIDFDAAASRDSRKLIIAVGSSGTATAGYPAEDGDGWFLDFRTGLNGAWVTRMFRNGNTVMGRGSGTFGVSNFKNVSKLTVVGDATITDTIFLRTTPLITSGSGYDVLVRSRSDSAVYALPYDSVSAGGGGSVNLGNTDLTQSAATRNYDIDDQNLYWLNTGTWRIYGSGTYSGQRLLEIDGTNSLGYFGPDAGSVFWGFNADSLLIDGIGLRNDSTNNKILVYNPATNTVSYSNWIGGGGGSGPSFGTDNQVPFTNSGGTDFDYSSGFTFNGTALTVNSGADVNVPNALIIATSTRSITIGPGAGNQSMIQNTGLDNNAGVTLRTRLSVDMGVFTRDIVYFQTNNSDRLRIGLTEAVLNEPGNSYDIRMEGDTDANLFFSDASTDRIGIGTATPGFKFDVNGMINTPGTEASTYRWAATATEVPATTTYVDPTNYIGSSTNYALFTPDAWLRVSVAGTLYGIPAYIITAP